MLRVRLRWLSLAAVLAGLGLLVLFSSGALPAGRPVLAQAITPEPFPFSDRYPAEVTLGSADEVAVLAEHRIDVGDVRLARGGRALPGAPFEPLLVEVYVNDAEAALLAQHGLAAQPIPNESLLAQRLYGPGNGAPNAWPTFSQFVARMQALQAAYPDIVRVMSIGRSVQGRDLWVLKISDNPDLEEDEPEFKYSSSHHGDETVGIELTLRLAELLADGYGSDPVATELVDGMEIWLWPIYNPDGYVNSTRYNAHGQDLNRDFPDRIDDPVDDPAGREPETQAAMLWGYDHRFVMGANYHGGAAVVNVPWDSVGPGFSYYAPDDTAFLQYGVGYSSRNPRLWYGGFPQGITRGWEWYIIYGGMQDWAYHWQGEHHVTIELGDTKKPPYDQMDVYWAENESAMIWWMQRALMGARGLVTDATTGEPLDATVDVAEIGKSVRTDPDVGDYHRLLLPGDYTLVVSATGYLPQTAVVTVVDGPATVRNFELSRVSQYAVMAGDSRVSGAPGETVTHTFTITNSGIAEDSYSIGLAAGDWPAALLDTSVGPLQPMEAGQVQVVVDIPSSLPNGTVIATDVLTIGVESVADPAVTTAAQGTTLAAVELGVAMAADQAQGAALPGAAVTYTLAVTNTGAYPDAYTLSWSGNQWPVEVSPTETPELAPGDAAQIAVRVQVPLSPAVRTDTVVLRATSSWDAGNYAEQSLLTRRLWGVYLPLIAK